MFCNHLVLSWSHPFKLQGEAWNKYCISIYARLLNEYDIYKEGFHRHFFAVAECRFIHPSNPIVPGLALELGQGCCSRPPGRHKIILLQMFCRHKMICCHKKFCCRKKFYCHCCHDHLVHPWWSLESKRLHLADSTVVAQNARHRRLSHLK